MRFSLAVNALFFVILQTAGAHKQWQVLASQSGGNELQAILSGSAFINSLLPIYIVQFTAVAILTTLIFIYAQSRFSITFSQLKVISEHIPNPFLAIALWAFIANTGLLILNGAFFLHSSHLTDYFRIWPATHLNTYICWAIVLFPIIYTLGKEYNRMWARTLTGFALLLVIFFEFTYWHPATPTQDATAQNEDKKPNIILIGIDSLRADLFHSHMPFLYSQLSDSVIFENSFTELGRTFPAWNTILTGQYPVTHKAQLNLMPREQLPIADNYLPKQLQEMGYNTYFAYDETRFANFSEEYGFDKVLSPRMGASDFLIGAVSDFPLINLLSLSKYADWLLPEVYGNRAIYKTYRAESFSETLEREIPTFSGTPTFLAVHFCLPHWPYAFASDLTPDFNYPEPYFPTNLKAVDNQLEKLMTSLKKKGYLENSRVVFLSDHGESWKHESVVFKSKTGEEKQRISYGHGSDLTSETGNRVLIAFKGFVNIESGLRNNSKYLATLADIKPTIMQSLTNTSYGYLRDDQTTIDGRALHSVNLPKDRVFPVETGTVLDLKDEHDNLDINKIVRSMMDRFQLNSNSLLTVRNESIKPALQGKRYGVRNMNQLFSKEKSTYFYYQLDSRQFASFTDLKEAKQGIPKPLFDGWCNWHREVECSNLQSEK